MAVFLVSVLVFALVIAGMAVGVMAGRAPIKGSCGGIGALGIDKACGICGGDAQLCETETRGGKRSAESTTDDPLYYVADKRK